MDVSFRGAVNAVPAYQQIKEPINNISFKKNIFDDFNTDLYTKPEPVTTPENKSVAPSISMVRVFFSRLTKEQVSEVNSSKMLPNNAKFRNGGITLNFIDFTTGTHILPKGYEVKNDRFGFTHVVKEGTQSWLFKKSDKT